jgi:cytochrome c oxidase subunit 1
MLAKLRAPGLYRAGLFLAIGVGFAFGVIALVRWASGFNTIIKPEGVLVVALLAAPLFALVGLGAFDYWFYWAAGKPTRAAQ